MKVSELEGALLDYWVGVSLGLMVEIKNGVCFRETSFGKHVYFPSTEWFQGGPIMERERIGTTGPGPMGGPDPDRYWTAFIDTGSYAGGGHSGSGRTPLIAAMRCFVASKFGEEVEDSK